MGSGYHISSVKFLQFTEVKMAIEKLNESIQYLTNAKLVKLL